MLIVITTVYFTTCKYSNYPRNSEKHLAVVFYGFPARTSRGCSFSFIFHKLPKNINKTLMETGSDWPYHELVTNFKQESPISIPEISIYDSILAVGEDGNMTHKGLRGMATYFNQI